MRATAQMIAEDNDREIHVAVVDDDAELREGLSWLIEHAEGMHCTGTYASYADARPHIESNAPDVVLMDIGLPDRSGIECVADLKREFPGVHALMLTVYSDEEKIFQSIRAGAVGYLLKNTPSEKLIDAIRDAHAGGAPMTGQVARKVLAYLQQPKGPATPLSARETEVLEALTEGLSYKAIAEKLFVSTHTVRFHLHNIYAKLHVGSRAEAVVKAMRGRIV